MNADSNQVKAIFIEAVEKHLPNQWPGFLDLACAGQPELRGRVEVLLEAHRDAGTAPHQARTEGPVPAPFDASGSVEHPGSVIGPYKLLQPIGEGGMGTVWMAEQTHPVQRMVALKLIKSGMDSRQIIARFEAERQALALMDHPNIARVFDAGATPDGRPFFVMELVKGMPITCYCDEHHLTPRQRLELFVPVCQAVQHAHQKGIIHRDLKPSNVLVCLYDGKPLPKVIDFGIAKAAGPGLTEQTLFTELGQVVGTLEYMSPEQAELNQLDIDTRCDIYSLGVLLYELLTGTTPLERKRFRAVAFLEVLRLIREEESPRPSTRLSTAEGLPSIAANRGLEPKKLSGLMRGELDWIVMKALEKDRNRRYETANGFAADVQRYLADEPVLACPPAAGYKLRKFVRRHRRSVLAATLVLLALLGGIVGTTVGLVQAEWALQAAAVADANEREQRRDKEQALGDRLKEEEAKNQANHQRIDALNGETKALKAWRQTAYYNWLQLAHNEYRANHVARADEMLDADKKCPVDLCGFEWHFLKRLCHSELSRFATAESEGGLLPRWCRFSADARWVVLSDGQGALHVYDTATENETCTLPIGFTKFNDVAFSHDGKRLAVCLPPVGQQDTIHVWDVATRARRAVLTGLKKRSLAQGFSGVAFSPDGRLLAGADQTGNLFVWNLQVAEEQFQSGPTRFIGHSIGALAVAPAGASLGGWVSLVGAAAGATADAVALRFQIAAHPDDKATATASWLTKPAFSPDSKLVVTASQGDQTVRIWNAETGKLVRNLGQGPDCTRVAFSPKGKWVAAGGGGELGPVLDVSVWVWNVEDGQTHSVIRGQSKPVTCLAFSPDEERLVTGSQDGTLTVWDIGTGHEIVTYRGHDRGVYAVAYTPDGNRLVAVGDDRVVRTWDARRHPERRLLRCRGAWQAAFSGDSRLVAAAAQHGTQGYWGTVIWDAETGQELAKFGNQEESAYAVALSPDGRLVAAAVDVGSTTGAVRVWDLRTGQLVGTRSRAHFLGQVIGAEAQAPVAAAVGGGPLGGVLLRLGAREGTNWDAFGLVRSLPEHGLVGPYYAVAWSPDGRCIAAGGQDRIVRVWDTATGKQLLELGGHTRTISAVVFSRDGKRLVSASGGITQKSVAFNPPIKLPLDEAEDIPDLKVWDVATGEELRSWTLPGKGPGLALSPDGDTVAVSFGDAGVQMRLMFDGGGATGMVFPEASPRPDVVRLYRVATGAEVAVLKGHTRPPWCVAFSPDGKRVVTGGGADETIKLWDANTGEEIMTVGHHPGLVTGVAFSPDGMKIVSTSFRESVLVWDATPMSKK